MATLKKIEFVNFGPYKIVGKEMRTKHEISNPIYPTKYQTIPSLWRQCFSDGTYETLVKMSDYIPTEISDDYIGYMRDYDESDGTFTYLVGMFMKTNTPIPDGYAFYDLPFCTIAKAWIEGEEYDIYPNAHSLTVDAINKNGYEVDWPNYFSCEVYTNSRFGIPKNNGERILILDYYIPCKKRS
ncbi:GyrI-like domain-containing protein [Tissierella sp. MSJ-40]|uniref:GyrI-like domain-containing protein n=1 Tax=Tissierella simiarum TaxID=2841534 RepID=A0ABS6E398_9FIRM|nr:GyrI-like domain-containing protein [Tissierella simiarum]MBU5437254.1 GyrI-like domain-containing protein [Tissierella simiarum]